MFVAFRGDGEAYVWTPSYVFLDLVETDLLNINKNTLSVTIQVSVSIPDLWLLFQCRMLNIGGGGW